MGYSVYIKGENRDSYKKSYDEKRSSTDSHMKRMKNRVHIESSLMTDDISVRTKKKVVMLCKREERRRINKV